MFFKKKKETKETQTKKVEVNNPADIMAMFDYDEKDGTVRFNPDKLQAVHQEIEKAKAKLPELKRLYVISRDNIKLPDAQEIVMKAAVGGYPMLLDKSVPLVWCSAYPDSLFGEVPLVPLLLEYVKKMEGETYLNSKSNVMKIEGKHSDYEYLIIALVE